MGVLKDYYYDDERRFVFTWKNEKIVDPNVAEFRITPIGNGVKVLIKNAFYNETLYAAEMKSDRDRRKVFSWMASEGQDEDFWEVTECPL